MVNSEFSPGELRAYGRALVLMASIDEAGMTTDEELVIKRMLLDIGLDEDASGEIWSAPRSEKETLVELSGIQSDLLRRSLVKDLLMVAYADGDFCSAEQALLERLRSPLGVDNGFQRRAEDWVLRGIEWQKDGLALCGLEEQ